MDAPASEMEMSPQVPVPEWTPEDIKKMQLARARKMLLEYEIKHDCIPGKKLSKRKTDNSHNKAGHYGRQIHKRSVRAQEEQKTSSDCDPLGDVTVSTGNPFPLSRKLNGLIFEVEVRKQRTKSIQQLQDSLNYLHKFLLAFQQDLVTFEQNASEMEELHRQSLLQRELLDQLQEKKDQDKRKLEEIKKEVKETLELQKTISLEKEQLQAQINALLTDKQSREVEAVEVAMVAEVAENVELEENQNTWSLTENLDSREESIEMASTALADVCSEQEEKTVILHHTPELLEKQQNEEPKTGNLNVLNWLPLSKLYPFFYHLNGPYPMQVFTV